jgi:hypothetical protein
LKEQSLKISSGERKDMDKNKILGGLDFINNFANFVVSIFLTAFRSCVALAFALRANSGIYYT